MEVGFGKGRNGGVEDIIKCTFTELVDLLRDSADIPRDPCDKETWWWLMHGIGLSGVRQRRLVDIDHMAPFIPLDVESGNPSLAELRLKLQGLPVILYSTSSAEVDDMHWRVVIGLDRPYTVAEHARIWRYYANRLTADEQTKNANRISFLPAAWTNRPNIFFAEGGRPARVDTILAMSPEITEHMLIRPNTSELRRAPDGNEIVTDGVLAAAQTGKVGGRFFRLMCSAAKRFRLEGWELDATELRDAALLASATFSAGKPRPNSLREAQRALDWAAKHFMPMSKLEKMRSRILWKQARRA